MVQCLRCRSQRKWCRIALYPRSSKSNLKNSSLPFRTRQPSNFSLILLNDPEFSFDAFLPQKPSPSQSLQGQPLPRNAAIDSILRQMHNKRELLIKERSVETIRRKAEHLVQDPDTMAQPNLTPVLVGDSHASPVRQIPLSSGLDTLGQKHQELMGIDSSQQSTDFIAPSSGFSKAGRNKFNQKPLSESNRPYPGQLSEFQD